MAHPLFEMSTVVVSIATLIVIYFMKSTLYAKNPLPPGPPPLLLLGNMLDLTSKELWLRVHQWTQKYGEICHLHILGKRIIFLNHADVAFELLEKRGAIYSSKPRLVMVGEMCGCENMVTILLALKPVLTRDAQKNFQVPFTPYGEIFKKRRKLMHQTLGPRSIPQYYDGLELETKQFIRALLSDPANYIRHIRRYSGGLTLSVVYGYKAASSNDKYLLLAEHCMDLLANEMAPGPGIWPVDIFPILRFIPSWAPGGSFKQKAKIWRVKMEEFVERPFVEAKESMKAGTILPSFCSALLESDEVLDHEREEDIKWTANSMYAASADTTISTISHLMLAMIYYPSSFEKARKEMEEVIGKDRLPTFRDRESLPYLECILNETWRWGSPVPLNLPHLLEEDDEYHGYIIPKGSLIIANIWAMLRDESIYPEPDTFRPERYLEIVDELDKKKMDPRNYMFGFGRRRCPGADLVDSSIWLLLATMVATVNISKPLDENGSIIEPDIDFNNLFFRTPKAFNFTVKSCSDLLDTA